MSGKASIEALNDLHGLLAEDFIRLIRSKELTAADRSVMRQFLKDNGVEQPAIPGSPTANLAATLPFAGSDNYTQ